jgi:integrase
MLFPIAYLGQAMYRNVSLRRREVNGQSTWTLIGPDGQPIEAFHAFAASLRTAPENTRNSYCRHLAEFIDYLIEATALVGGGRQLTKLQLTETLEAYGEYLQLGIDASKPIAQAVARSLQPKANKASSVTPKKAAVRRFLNLSEQVRKELLELARLHEHRQPVAETALLPELEQKRRLTVNEVRAIEANSMLAGVIAGGPKFVHSVVLGEESEAMPYDESRAFPYDKVMDLIDAMPNWRDKTFYALLAASGCRSHEALQALGEDVSVREGRVRLVDPKSRQWHPSYRALSAVQRQRLAWKGRTTDLTLLIEPFASAFFDSLKGYLDKEYLAHGKHDFLLQYLTGDRRGMPYFLSSASSRLESFHRVCRRIGVVLPPDTGSHSLRHMYGTYTLNYFPRANGDFGLPVPMVQQLLAHAGPKQTLKYAKFDDDLIKLEIQNANRVLFQHGTPLNLLELKVLALQAQLAKVQAQLPAALARS